MKRITWLIGVMLLLFFIAFPTSAFVQSLQNPKTIRVGYIDLENFIEKKDNGMMEGYGVSYLNEIAKYTGWQYEYVFGTWAECLEWLKAGEIDLLLPAEYSEDRGADYIFSKYSVCMDYAALYALRANESLFYQDYTSFNGIKIGMIKKNHLNEVFEKFANQHEFYPQYVYYDNLTDMQAALSNGTVDAIINGSLNNASQQQLLAKFEFMPAYFIMGKNNAALMEELNRAMYDILLNNPYFTAMLNEKFYSSLQIKGFTRAETEYIKQSEPLIVVCDLDNYPFEWYDKKLDKFEGIYPDILRIIAKQSNLQFQMLKTKTAEESRQLIRSGQADLILSFYGSPLSAQEDQVTYTEPYMRESYSLIGNRSVPFDINAPLKLALRPGSGKLQQYIREHYPNWTIQVYATEQACLKKVNDREADLAVMNAAEPSAILNQYPNLGVISTLPISIPISIGISTAQQPILQSILDKAILFVSKKEIEASILKNTFLTTPQITFYYLLQHYLAEVLIVVLAIVVSLCSGLIFLYRERARTRQIFLLALKNNKLQETVMLAQHADRAHNLYEALYNTVRFGILQYEFKEDTRHITLLYANKGAASLFDIRQQGGNYHFFATESTLDQIRRIAADLTRVGVEFPFEGKIHTVQKTVWISGNAELLLQEQGKKIVQATFMDVTHQKEFEQQLKQRSEMDAMTNLFNKGTAEAFCRDYLEQDAAEGSAALLVMDIDRFKLVNDTYGHQYGDVVLCKFAAVLRAVFSPEDIIGRIGGDEFIILMKAVSDPELVAAKAKEICRRTEAIEAANGKPLISCSIGIATTDTSRVPYDELFSRADRALYRTKMTGKNGWCFFEP